MLKEEENNHHLNNKSSKGVDTQSLLFDLLEGEKALRYLNNKQSIEEMKCKVLKQRIDQRKKQIESTKGELKKLKLTSEKNKDQIALLTRESDFLTEMINFSVMNINK